MTGNLHYITDLKEALDKQANVTPPQNAKDSGRREIGPNGPGMGRNRTPRRDAPDPAPNHSGAKPAYDEVMVQKARQAEHDQQQSVPDYASMSDEAFDALIAPNRNNVIGATMRQARAQQRKEQERRDAEQRDLSRRQQLWKQAEELGGHAPKGRSPPALAQLRFNLTRLGPRRDCYG